MERERFQTNSFDLLGSALRSSCTEVRREALQRLRREDKQALRETLIDLLADPLPAVRRDAAEGLVPVTDEYLAGLIAAQIRSGAWAVRECAVRALAGTTTRLGRGALLDALADEVPSVSTAAAHSIRETSHAELLQEVLTVMRSGRGAHRAVCALALQGATVPVVVESLIGMLQHGAEGALRAYAALALGGTRTRLAQKSLAGAVGDEDPEVRLQALEALRGIEEPFVREAIKRAVRDVHAGVRLVAVRIAGLGYPKAYESALVERLLTDPSAVVRAEAARALTPLLTGRVTRALLQVLECASEMPLKEASLRALSGRDEPAVREVLQKYSSGGTEDPLTIAAWHTWGSLTPSEEMVHLFTSTLTFGADPFVRRAALAALRKVDDPWVVELAARRMAITRWREEDHGLRDELLKFVSSRISEAQIPLLLSAVASDPVPAIRSRAVVAVGHFSTPKVVRGLIEALRDSAKEVRLSAALELAPRHELEVTEALQGALAQEEDSAVRVVLVQALRGRESLRVAEVLSNALGDNDVEVRRAAAFALRGTTHAPSLKLLVEELLYNPRGARSYAALALEGVTDPLVLEILTLALEQPDGALKSAASWVLRSTPQGPRAQLVGRAEQRGGGE